MYNNFFANNNVEVKNNAPRKTSKKMSDSLNRLVLLNKVAAGLFGVLVIALTAWTCAVTTNTGIDTSLWSIRTRTGTCLNNATVVQFGDAMCVEAKMDIESNSTAMVTLVLVFMALTALFHVVIFTDKNRYGAMLENKNNYLRWIEYSVTSSIMLALIMIMTGQKDTDVFFMALLCNACVMWMGDMVEKSMSAGNKSQAWQLTGLAWVLWTVAWFPICRTFSSTANMPDFVYAIFATMIVLYTTFGGVQLLQLIGVLESYEKVELAYVSLSYIAKTTLSFLIFGGLIGREK